MPQGELFEKERLTTNIVGPDGPLTARQLHIGEAPGQEENDYSPPTPFVGSAGRLYNRCLKLTGQLRMEILVNNIFKQQPPRNKVEYYFQDSKKTLPTWEGQEHIDALQIWLEKLLKLREETGIGPNIILAMGAVPMYILTGKKRISKWRGSILPCTLAPFPVSEVRLQRPLQYRQ